MLTTGNQLRAGRSLLGLGQIEAAELIGVAVSTIRRLEAVGAESLTGRDGTRERIQAALERAGIEFLDGDAPGVRLRPPTKRHKPRRDKSRS